MKTNLLKTALTLFGIICFSLALAQDYMGAPKKGEKVIAPIVASYTSYDKPASNVEIYSLILARAQKEYPNKVIDIREIRFSYTTKTYTTLPPVYLYSCTAKVVEFISPETKSNETLVKAVDKALSRVNGGSRLAIDQISVLGSELTKNDINDQLIDILLENGYKVVAKEYLEKLQEEQERQQRGGFNERTTAKTENFSGVGYFLNVRVNEKSIRIQVVNVST